jgi:hypothetical protein
METKLQVLKPAKIFGDPYGLANFRFANSRGFPASYQRFATQYGWGRSLGNYLVYIPTKPHYCDSWQQARAAVRSSYIHDLYEYEGFFSAQHVCLMGRMECFAKSETGTYLFWDIESRPSQNEFDIYAFDFREEPFLIGRSLDEVWFNLTRESAATAALRAAPRQAVFEGFDSMS